jgi:hypothetical protein
MQNRFIDTETCGLHSVMVLLQYALDDGPITLWEPWRNPAIDTMKLIEYLMEGPCIGFNWAYDMFHLQKFYNMLERLPDTDVCPEDAVDLLAEIEPAARLGSCVKPHSACDLMLIARKGKYQATMGRKDIKIKRIPTAIVQEVHAELEQRVKLDEIYFARRKDKYAPRWKIMDRDDGDEFKDIVLKFAASSGLKQLVMHALGRKEHEVLKYGDIQVDKVFLPVELGYAPFAKAVSSKEKKWNALVKVGQGYKSGWAWPGVIRHHISHWAFNSLAREYAGDDIVYTRELWKHLGRPEPGDDDSELACMVGSVRWRGFAFDEDKIRNLRTEAIKVAASAPKAPGPVKHFIMEKMDPIEKTIIGKSTKKIILEEVAKWTTEADDGTEVKHPAADRAQQVLDARQAKAEIDIFDKLLKAGRFHASFVVIGALSSRMSGGGGGFNAQGIKRTKTIRSAFTLADPGFVLTGGDFDSFEVVLAIAYYGDEKLSQLVQSGKKIHALFGMHVYPGMSYDDIMADKEKYTRSKSAVFAMIYGGEAYTLKTRLGVELEVAEKAFQSFITEYPGIGEGRKRIFNDFCSMKQVGGIGSKIEWHDPKDYIESMFGFRRYFTLENLICKVLFNMAESPPKGWNKYKEKVVRRDREQTVAGATRSAIFASAFAIQAANMRAAGNHVIQSSGATTTKKVQRRVWDTQPSGVNPWLVVPMNVHDEIMCPCVPVVKDNVAQVVNDTVESFRTAVPLIKLEWGQGLKSWADK